MERISERDYQAALYLRTCKREYDLACQTPTSQQNDTLETLDWTLPRMIGAQAMFILVYGGEMAVLKLDAYSFALNQIDQYEWQRELQRAHEACEL